MGGAGFVPGNLNLKKSAGNPNLAYNMKDNLLFKADEANLAYEVSATQIPAMVGGSVADLYMTKGHIREPHWHPNAWELDVVIEGRVIVSILNPDTSQLINNSAGPGQVVFIPMGWLHWITPVTDRTHLHLFFNSSQVENAEVSDFLRTTPSEVFKLSYNIDPALISAALAPIKAVNETVFVGPPASSGSSRPTGTGASGNQAGTSTGGDISPMNGSMRSRAGGTYTLPNPPQPTVNIKRR
ncbi:cupin domain-containing protein [Paenibacillus kobensis]|uniref:cupin domain-containing protein n=1 Tax=Paenibacillus kobensis TaxID=59841 RepID=UPI000FD913B6|nr:cupin domain-containing protein [Paenibacillus kobensis]